MRIGQARPCDRRQVRQDGGLRDSPAARDEGEEEEEENRIKSNIKSSLDTAAQQINELSNQVNSSNQKRTKKKSKYLANLYEVPLLKALMKGDAVKRQTVWKALDQHLEKQIEKEEVKEEMFRYSF